MSAAPGTNLVFLNGEILPAESARISVMDRGFLFGDGVYELVRCFRGVPVGMDLHVQRLGRSLEEARIRGFRAEEYPRLVERLLAATGLRDACVYLQVTRGCEAVRSHVPPPQLTPTVFASVTPSGPFETLVAPEAVRAVVAPDLRWHRCAIKTISLMGNVLSLLPAAEAGAQEAILHRDGLVSEGCSTNVLAWTGRALATPPLDSQPPILHGVSRAMLLDAARAAGILVEERALPLAELRAAPEVMITSSRRLVSSVVSLDGAPVGGGRTGEMATRLFTLLRTAVERTLPLPAGVA